MNHYVYQVTVTTDKTWEAVTEDLEDLLAGVADGFVGDPDRPLGGADITVHQHGAVRG